MQKKERGREKDNLDNPSKIRNSANRRRLGLRFGSRAPDSPRPCRPRSRRASSGLQWWKDQRKRVACFENQAFKPQKCSSEFTQSVYKYNRTFDLVGISAPVA
ncbi:hypothetical protein ACS0TY_036018 [Phlomoides rotata]